MADKDYIYAVSRVRYREKYCLDKAFFNTLLAAKSYDEAVRLLADKGWEGEGINGICENQLKNLESFINEIADKKDMPVLFAVTDWHNLKAAVKNAVFKAEDETFLPDGAYESALIKNAVRDEEYDALPGAMGNAAKEALKRLRETGDGQLCDLIIDKAMLNDMLKNTEGFFGIYAKHVAATANIKTALRGERLNKKAQFYDEALCDVKGVINAKALKEAALKGEAAEYLRSTDYNKCVEAMSVSDAAFEKACDDKLMSEIKKYKREFFGIEPIAAYYLGRVSEIRNVRVILTAKLYDVSGEYVKERLRDTYV